MKFLFISIGSLDNLNAHEIYTDLVRNLHSDGHEVFVLCLKGKNTSGGITNENGINIIRVQCDNLKSSNLIKKGIATLLIGRKFYSSYRKYLKNEKFDMILYSTPPITISGIVKKIKKKTSAVTYLMLKDIFPQNAVDLQMFGRFSFIGRYFRLCEKRLYGISDFIGCMSPKNVEYLLLNNPKIDKSCVEVNANSVELLDYKQIDKSALRAKYSLPEDKTIFVYGGNIGKPQGVDFIIECLEKIKNEQNILILIVGGGTECSKLKKYITMSKNENVSIIPSLPTEDYLELIKACDVGLVFLDSRFTIPNFPSRILPYMQVKLPVISCTDPNTDLGQIIENGDFGARTISNNSDSFAALIRKYASDKALISRQGENARAFLEKNYDVRLSCKLIYEKILNRR